VAGHCRNNRRGLCGMQRVAARELLRYKIDLFDYFLYPSGEQAGIRLLKEVEPPQGMGSQWREKSSTPWRIGAIQIVAYGRTI